MIQEAIELQKGAVARLVETLKSKREVTFRAPTGSGKTRMMADMMQRVLAERRDVVFIVSTLSKGGLAQQNYNVFRRLAESDEMPLLRPWLVSTEASGEERLYIPTDCNVYVLPRDLYKKGGLLMQGTMDGFLYELTMTQRREVWLVRDECHQATNNLDSLKDTYFSKTINFSATPNLRRGQNPDVEITDEEAEQVCLIKHVEPGDDEDGVDAAVEKLVDIKEEYINLLGVHPCLIIQISNKEKAEEEWHTIKNVLDRHPELKWMSIMDKADKCMTNDKVGRLPVSRWKDYARENASTIDVIVFKMVISEGWDIPRACMLYQMRDTKSRQLDEQVMGRVRRNPRLADFERLPETARQLALTAWVWGILPERVRKVHRVRLHYDDIPQEIRVKTTRLRPLTERKGFDIETLLASRKEWDAATSIFQLHSQLSQSEPEVQEMCYDYAKGDIQRWLKFCNNLQAVRREFRNFVCNYEESMEEGAEVSFPLRSMYVDNENYERIRNWVWRRRDNENRFSFDSAAEKEWASILKDLAGETTARYHEGKVDDGDPRYLWGKNYPMGSEIRFQYYDDGLHTSYPDFVMKDKHGRIHIFEVKSVNTVGKQQFDSREYKAKVGALAACYRQCSKVTGQLFYLPVLKGEVWQISRFKDGGEDTLTVEQLEETLK